MYLFEDTDPFENPMNVIKPLPPQRHTPTKNLHRNSGDSRDIPTLPPRPPHCETLPWISGLEYLH